MNKYPIPEAALDDRLAFVGTSGSGKTYAAGTAVERLLAKGAKVVVVDPLDVWWGLRVKADGVKAGYPVVIFGGAHGDLPLSEHAGGLIGEAVASMAESCIVSLGGMATKAAADYEPLPTGDALREAVMSRLPEGERKVLGVLISAYPSPVARDLIEVETGYKRATRDAYILRLKVRELVETLGPGQVKASDDLFTEAA